MTWKDLEAVYNHLKSMGECHTQKEFADIIGQSPENVSKKLGTLNPVMPKTVYKIKEKYSHVFNESWSFPLHSHIARHTFATYMLNNKISLDSVSVMLGHTNTVQTRRYAKTLAQTVRDDFDKVAEKLKKAPSSQTESQT